MTLCRKVEMRGLPYVFKKNTVYETKKAKFTKKV